MEFNEIYSELKSKIEAFICYKVNGDKLLAEDLTQEVFIKVLNGIDAFDSDKSSIHTWVFNITNNHLIDYWRKKKMDTMSISNYVNEDGNETLQIADVVNAIENSEVKEMIGMAISQLPKTYKRIGNLFFNHNYSYEEISNIMGIPLGTVKGKIFRTRKLLEAMF